MEEVLEKIKISRKGLLGVFVVVDGGNSFGALQLENGYE